MYEYIYILNSYTYIYDIYLHTHTHTHTHVGAGIAGIETIGTSKNMSDLSNSVFCRMMRVNEPA
jgi:hypothetical protein